MAVSVYADYLGTYQSIMQEKKLLVEVELKHGTMEGMLERVIPKDGIYFVNGCKFWFEVNKFTTKKIIDKKDGCEMTTQTTLKNGVVKFPLTVENDFEAVQAILDRNYRTSDIDGEYAFNERVSNDFEGTYQMKIERHEDFLRFKDMLDDESCRYGEKMQEVRQKWYEDSITWDEYNEQCNAINNCKCDKCKIADSLTIEQWTIGKIDITEWNEYIKDYKTRTFKLGAYMKKIGIKQEIIDFYSAQIKTEKDIFLTISGKAQHIAGMSNYALMDSWDGYNGTSCQDTRHGGGMAIALGGALHDDKFFVAMLHDNKEDVENMQDKLKARVMMRLVTIEDEQHLIPTRLYGDNETKNLLNGALKKLREVDIWDMEVRDGGYYHSEDANGAFEMEGTKSVLFERDIEEDVTIDCPCCGGSGEVTVESYDINMDEYIEHEVNCPHCDGDGTIEYRVSDYVREYIEVETTITVLPYYDCEGWEHEVDNIYIPVNYEFIKEVKAEME